MSRFPYLSLTNTLTLCSYLVRKISPPASLFQSNKESRKEVVFMETFDAIRTALAVRHFKDTPIPEPIVRQIVEAGRLTASGGNRQPWYFIVVRDFAASRQPCFCCSALIWSILSMISCRLCSVEVCFSSSSSTFNSPASCSQSVIELFLPCVAINATRG